MSNPTEQHWSALKRMLQYLQSIENLSICYSRVQNNLSMLIWTDSSWQKDLNDSKSTNSYVVLMAERPVAWKSAKQQSVALSSTEAEYLKQAMTATQTM